MEKLPIEMIQCILNFLPLEDLMSCTKVSRRWNRLSKNCPEYDFVYTPKVIELKMVNCYKRVIHNYIFCDMCHFSHESQKTCINCKRLFCSRQIVFYYDDNSKNKEQYCLKCLHDLKLTYCNKTWKECREYLKLKKSTDYVRSYKCTFRRCDTCHKLDHVYYKVNSLRVCGSCKKNYDCQICGSLAVIGTIENKRVCMKCYENV